MLRRSILCGAMAVLFLANAQGCKSRENRSQTASAMPSGSEAQTRTIDQVVKLGDCPDGQMPVTDYPFETQQSCAAFTDETPSQLCTGVADSLDYTYPRSHRWRTAKDRKLECCGVVCITLFPWQSNPRPDGSIDPNFKRYETCTDQCLKDGENEKPIKDLMKVNETTNPT